MKQENLAGYMSVRLNAVESKKERPKVQDFTMDISNIKYFETLNAHSTSSKSSTAISIPTLYCKYLGTCLMFAYRNCVTSFSYPSNHVTE